jgi:hypothetical protein
MADSKTKTNTEEVKKITPTGAEWTVEKKKRKRKPRKKAVIATQTWATEKEVIKELITPQKTEKSDSTEKVTANNEQEHTVAGIDDLQAYIASKKNVLPEKTIPTNNELLAADWTNLLTVPGIFAVVPHAKWDHKLVFKKDQIPEWLLDDPKNRIPWTLYKKNGAAIYLVNLVMKEHPTLRDARWNNYDVWIIDDEKQLNEQLQSIKNGMWGGENFSAPIIAWKEMPLTTNTTEATINNEKDVVAATAVIPELIPEVIPETEAIVEEVTPIEQDEKATINENETKTTNDDISKEVKEETIPETTPEVIPEVIHETEKIPKTSTTNENTEEVVHHPFTTPDSEKIEETPVSIEPTIETGEHPFIIPDIDIDKEPTIDMNSLESIDNTLAWDTDAVNLNFHDSIIEETTPEAPTEVPTDLPEGRPPVNNYLEEVKNEWIDLNFDIPEIESTEQPTESGETPSNEIPNETPQPEVVIQNETNTISLDVQEDEQHTNTENTPEVWSPMFTPIAVNEPNTEPEFNLDDLQIEEVVTENPTTVWVETTTSPTIQENLLWVIATETVTQTPAGTTDTTTTVTTTVTEVKKWIPMATKLRLVWFVLIILCLWIIAFVMFPSNKWEKDTENTWSTDTEVENTIIDENTDEDSFDESNPIEDMTNPLEESNSNADTTDTVPDENNWPFLPPDWNTENNWPIDEENDDNTNTPPDNTQNTNPTGTLTLDELKTKLEAQQLDARKVLNVAKLIDNKAAIKFSLAANLKAGNVLDRIETDPTITADDVASEVDKIDRYLEEANKLVQ